MPLPDILGAIAAEADREVALLRAQADAEVDAILLRVDADVAALDRQCEDRRRRYVATTVARIVHGARLDAIRHLQAARERVASTVLGQVHDGLARIRERPDHAAILARWLTELRAALPEGTRVRVAPDDVGLIRTLAPDLEVAADPSLRDGVVLDAPDGRTGIATPEVRAMRAEPAIRQAIARALAR